MIFRKALRPRPIRTLVELPYPSQYLRNTPPNGRAYSQIKSTFSHELFVPISIFRRTISLSSQLEDKIDTESINSDNIQERNNKTKKPLDVVFREAVGLSQKLQESESESDSDSENDTKELKSKLRKLEIEVRKLDENKRKLETRKLSAFFSKKRAKGTKREEVREDVTVYKELPPDMVLLADHLYRKGYFKDANYLPDEKFDATCFEDSYARTYLKFAAGKFARENNQITQWLSKGELKKVAEFGCPSLGRRTILCAKSLRQNLKIKEKTVCRKCVWNKKCEFVNRGITHAKNLNLAMIMRVITLYALESFPPELVVPEEVKKSVSRLLKDILYQSQSVE